jgi:hypothetical protein
MRGCTVIESEIKNVTRDRIMPSQCFITSLPAPSPQMGIPIPCVGMTELWGFLLPSYHSYLRATGRMVKESWLDCRQCWEVIRKVETISTNFLSSGYQSFRGSNAAGAWIWPFIRSSAKGKNVRSYTSSLYACMAWCLIKHRDNFQHIMSCHPAHSICHRMRIMRVGGKEIAKTLLYI